MIISQCQTPFPILTPGTLKVNEIMVYLRHEKSDKIVKEI